MDRVKIILSRHRTHQSYFLAVILPRHVSKKNDCYMVKNKIVCFPKIWKPPRQHFGFFFEIGKIWQSAENWQVFELGVIYSTC